MKTFPALSLALVAIGLAFVVPELLNTRTATFWITLVPHILGFDDNYDVSKMHPEPVKAGPIRPTLPIFEVDAVNDPDWEVKFGHVWNERREPVVLRGIAHKYFADLDNYNVSWFANTWPDREIGVFTNMTQDKSMIFMKMKEFVERLERRETVYLKALSDPHDEVGLDRRSLWKLFGVEHLGDAVEWLINGPSALYFIGHDRVNTRLHCDVGESIFLPLQGRKRWTFYAPHDSVNLYPTAHKYNVAYNSQVDVFNPDLEKYPLYSFAQRYEVTIGPGDILAFPSMWWHAVENLDKVTIGADIPSLNLLGSMARNPLLALGSNFNYRTWAYTFQNCIWDRKPFCMQNLYFEGYIKE